MGRRAICWMVGLVAAVALAQLAILFSLLSWRDAGGKSGWDKLTRPRAAVITRRPDMALVDVLGVTYRCGTSVYKPSDGYRAEGTVRIRVNGPCLDCYDAENRPEFRGYLTCAAWESMTLIPNQVAFPVELDIPIYASSTSATGVVSWTAQHCSGGDETAASSLEVLVDTAKPTIVAEVESLGCDPWQVVVRVNLTRAESWRYAVSSQSVDSGTLAIADGACSFTGQTVTLTGSLSDTITIEATNANGTTSTTFALTPVTASGSIAASPTTVEPGEPVTLTWSVSVPLGELVGVDAEIDNGVGPVFSGTIDGPQTGTVTVWPMTTTTYTLTVGSDCVSRTCSVTVTVAAPDPGTAPWINGQTERLPFTVQRDHISADLTSHRLLVVIDDESRGTTLGSWCAADGSDVFFAASDGTTVLTHQLIAFAVTNGKALGIWRLTVASLLAAEDVTLYAYCGATSPTASNPAAVWTGHAGAFPLDETSGSTAINLIGSNNGTYVGSLPNAATGVISKCQYFTGSAGNYINAGNIGATSTSITLSAWVKWDELQDATPVIATKRDSGCNWALAKSSNSYGGSTNNLTFSFHASGYWRLWHTTNANLQADTWYFIVVTYNGTSNPKVYVNGVLCSGFWNTSQPWYAAGPVALASGTDPVQIGGRMDSGEPDPHYGWIDDVRILTGTVLPQSFAEFETYNVTEADHELTFLPMQSRDVRTPTSSRLPIGYAVLADQRTAAGSRLPIGYAILEDVRTARQVLLPLAYSIEADAREATASRLPVGYAILQEARVPTASLLPIAFSIESAFVRKCLVDLRGLYRIFAPAEYRLFRSTIGPPTPADQYATSQALPHTPADLFADGTWYLACSYFNGVLDSGFLPIGPHGETFLRLDVSAGLATGEPPAAPGDLRLEVTAAGVIRLVALYAEAGDLRADQWAIAYSIDGTDPPANEPTIAEAMTGSPLEILDYLLPAQPHATTVKVRLQVRRNDGTADTPVWVYSEASTVLTAIADALGPDAPLAIEHWQGRVSGES